MIQSVVTGIVAAGVIAISGLLLKGGWGTPVLILVITLFAGILQRFVLDRRPGIRTYDGLADLFIHIHSPATPDSPIRWTLRGVISFLLAVFGSGTGVEGAAVEICQGLAMRVRSRSARWFEQRRRTDVAAALAGGVAAAFEAPFAAVILPIELGIGGPTIRSAITSFTAFLTTRFLVHRLPIAHFETGNALIGYRFSDWREWVGVILIGILAGLAGAGIVRFVRYSQNSLLDLFQTQTWIRTLAGGVLLFLVGIMHRNGFEPSFALFDQVLWLKRAAPEVGLLFFTQVLSIALVVSAFGTVGVLWPLMAVGGFLGFCVNYWFLGGIEHFCAAAGFAGGAAIWGAVLGAPMTAALVAFEQSQSIHLLIPCFAAGWIARETRRAFKTNALSETDLEARGVSIRAGRSLAVLDAISVRDAMVTDHEVVHQQEPVSELYSRLLKARYPFLPVVNSQGAYVGLLTVDLVQDAWRAQGAGKDSQSSPLVGLVEAKDLLYRSGFKVPVVKVNDRLSATTGIFSEIPCVPVLSDDGRVQGLLFVYNVRLAYEREVIRRSLSFEDREA